MFRMHDRAAALRVIVVFCMAMAACSYALRPPVVEAGRAFPDQRSNEVQRGDAAAKLRSTLGEPLEVRRDAETEHWRYYMRVRGAEMRRLFGVIPLNDSITRTDYEVVAVVRRGFVETIDSATRPVK